MQRKTSKAGLDRAVVVQAAAALADTQGLAEVTLTQLASHLNVRLPSLYNHVAGLPGLRRELALFGLEEMSRNMGQAVMGKAGDDAIMALAYTYRAFIKAHPGLYTATLRAPDPADTAWQATAAEVLNIVIRALSAYKLSDADVIHEVRAFRSIVHGFATLENGTGFGIPLAPDETFLRLLHMFIEHLHSTTQTNTQT